MQFCQAISYVISPWNFVRQLYEMLAGNVAKTADLANLHQQRFLGVCTKRESRLEQHVRSRLTLRLAFGSLLIPAAKLLLQMRQLVGENRTTTACTFAMAASIMSPM